MIDTNFPQKILDRETVIINAGPQLDNNNAHEMVEAITGAQSEGYKFIILDMQQLEFISSAGVGSILGTVETSREAGGDIVLCNASDSIIKVLEVLDLAEYLTIRKDMAELTEITGTKG